MARTMGMVSLGAALFTLTALVGLTGGDPARVPGTIVSGVGFLGAGVITQPRGGTSSASLTTIPAEALPQGSPERTAYEFSSGRPAVSVVRPIYGLTTAAAVWVSTCVCLCS